MTKRFTQSDVALLVANGYEVYDGDSPFATKEVGASLFEIYPDYSWQREQLGEDDIDTGKAKTLQGVINALAGMDEDI